MSREAHRGSAGAGRGGREIADAPAIDPDRWADLAEFDAYDPGTVADLVASFATHAPVRLDALDAAVAARDLPAVERLAHALRGTAGNLGAVRVAQALATIERDAAGGRAPAEGVVAAVRALAEDAVTEAERLLG